MVHDFPLVNSYIFAGISRPIAGGNIPPPRGLSVQFRLLRLKPILSQGSFNEVLDGDPLRLRRFPKLGCQWFA
jgi:hypothetical protein